MAKFRSKFTFEPGGIFSRMALPKAFQKRQSETRFKQEWNVPLGKYGMAKYQRGSISMMCGGGAMAAASGMVVISGQTNSNFVFGDTVWAGIRFNADGSIDEQGTGAATYNQVDPGEWWSLEPDGSIGASYDVRATSTGGGTWNQAAAVDNAWVALSTARQWNVSVLSKFSPDVQSAWRVFEIGPTGTATADDSSTYSCTAEN